MKMGIKEFREKIAEVSAGDEVVIVTHRGKRVGRYIPERLHRPAKDIDLSAWAKKLDESSRHWRATTPDWRDRLRRAGFLEEEIAELEADDRCS
jgi:hypothetical protein